MLRTILLTFQTQNSMVDGISTKNLILARGEVANFVRTYRIENNQPRILNNRSSCEDAMNLFNLTENSAIDLTTVEQTIHVQIISDALESNPMSLYNLKKLPLNFAQVYCVFNSEGNVCGITGCNNIIQMKEYIPILYTKGSFKIAFNSIPDGVIHIAELTKSLVYKLEQKKVDEMIKDSEAMDKLMNS